MANKTKQKTQCKTQCHETKHCDYVEIKVILGTCGLSVTTFFHQVLNYYYLTVYIMFKPKMSLEGSVH